MRRGRIECEPPDETSFLSRWELRCSLRTRSSLENAVAVLREKITPWWWPSIWWWLAPWPLYGWVSEAGFELYLVRRKSETLGLSGRIEFDQGQTVFRIRAYRLWSTWVAWTAGYLMSAIMIPCMMIGPWLAPGSPLIACLVATGVGTAVLAALGYGIYLDLRDGLRPREGDVSRWIKDLDQLLRSKATRTLSTPTVSEKPK